MTETIEIKKLDILTKKFDNVDYVNDLLKHYAENKIPIEIKKCEYMTKSGNPKNPLRYGRFSFDKERHEFLEINKGYYLLFVYYNDFIVCAKLIEANDIHFSKLIMWRRLIDKPNFDISELEV